MELVTAPSSEAVHTIVEEIPHVVRGTKPVPEAYARGERQWNLATALFGERRFEEAATAFVRVAEISSPALSGGYRAEFLQARSFAYANAASAWAAAGMEAVGKKRLALLMERDLEARSELRRALKLLGGD